MNLIFYKTSHLYFKDTDRELFKEITGTTISFLEDEIQKMPPQHAIKIYSNEKFIQSERLNKLGLHIYRILLSRRIYESRNTLADDPRITFFQENGYLIIKDFLEEDILGLLIKELIYAKQKNIPKQKIYLSKVLERDKHQMDFLKRCANVPHFAEDSVNGFPRTELWNHSHFQKDPQYKFHTDTFQPTFKCWIYLTDISIEHGPLNIVPKSHLPSRERLKWDYENSLITPENPLWNHRVQSGGAPGSFRVYESGAEEIELQEINRLGLPAAVSCVGGQNTFVAANTYAFHKRGAANVGTERNSLSIQYRPQAFGDYK